MPCTAGPATSNLACNFIQKTPVGVEPTSSCFAGSRRAVWLQRRSKCPRQESNLVFDLRRVACESGTLRGQCLRFKYLAEESNLVLQIRSLPCSSITLASASSPSRNRTWSNSFGSCRAIRHTHGPNVSVSRPGIEPGLELSESPVRSVTLSRYGADGWIRTSIEPVYKTGAFLIRATSASTSARIRTPSASFGGWLLSQEHTRVKRPRPCDRERSSFTSAIPRSSTRR